MLQQYLKDYNSRPPFREKRAVSILLFGNSPFVFFAMALLEFLSLNIKNINSWGV